MDERTIVIKKSSSFAAFMRGAIIGAGIALLLAPRAGSETREMITERGSDLYNKAVDFAGSTRDRAENIIQDARNKFEDTFKGGKVGDDESKRELKREVEILEDINNPTYPL